jgi:hypothetical protein
LRLLLLTSPIVSPALYKHTIAMPDKKTSKAAAAAVEKKPAAAEIGMNEEEQADKVVTADGTANEALKKTKSTKVTTKETSEKKRKDVPSASRESSRARKIVEPFIPENFHVSKIVCLSLSVGKQSTLYSLVHDA